MAATRPSREAREVGTSALQLRFRSQRLRDVLILVFSKSLQTQRLCGQPAAPSSDAGQAARRRTSVRGKLEAYNTELSRAPLPPGHRATGPSGALFRLGVQNCGLASRS